MTIPRRVLIDSHGGHCSHIMMKFVVMNFSSIMKIPQTSGVVIGTCEKPIVLFNQLTRIDRSCMSVIQFDFNLEDGDQGGRISLTEGKFAAELIRNRLIKVNSLSRKEILPRADQENQQCTS